MPGARAGVRTPKAIRGGCPAPALLDPATWGVTDRTRPQAGRCHLAAACVPSMRWPHCLALFCTEQGGTAGFSDDTGDPEVRARCCDL